MIRSLLVFLLLAVPVLAQDRPMLYVAVVGDSTLRPDFLEALRVAAAGDHFALQIVPRTDATRTYTVLIAQESTVGSAAAAVMVLDKDGEIAATIVRSGRLSAKGALNACAKELVKKLTALTR